MQAVQSRRIAIADYGMTMGPRSTIPGPSRGRLRGCGRPAVALISLNLIDLHCHPSSALLSHRSCLRFPQAFPTSVCLKCASSSSWQCSTYSCRPTGSGKRGARAGSQVAPDPTEPPFTVEPPSATALLSAHRPTHPVAGLALALACANDTRMRPGTTRI